MNKYSEASDLEEKEGSSGPYRLIIISLITYILVTLIFHTSFSISQVSGMSMKPTIFNGDRLLAVKYPSIFKRKLKRGDIILFKAPHNKKYGFGKRVIGLPQDEIYLEEGKVYLNGQELIEDYIAEDTKTWPDGRYTSWLVGEDEVFVMGDNRQMGGSNDSRSFGTIPIEDVTHYVIFRLYPRDRGWGYLY